MVNRLLRGALFWYHSSCFHSCRFRDKIIHGILFSTDPTQTLSRDQPKDRLRGTVCLSPSLLQPRYGDMYSKRGTSVERARYYVILLLERTTQVSRMTTYCARGMLTFFCFLAPFFIENYVDFLVCYNYKKKKKKLSYILEFSCNALYHSEMTQVTFTALNWPTNKSVETLDHANPQFYFALI